jgi:hypothetical protein
MNGQNVPGQPKSYKPIIVIIVIILLVVFLVLIMRACLRNRLYPASNRPDATAGGTPSPGTGGAFPEMREKPKPSFQPYKGCPPEGDGGDRATNMLKNRVDEGNYLQVQFAAVEKLPWPKTVERKNRSTWSASDASTIARYEGTPVVVEGYLADAKEEGPETPNCHGADHDFRDFHIWLTQSAGEDRTNSIVIEMTPPVRASHPNWTTKLLRQVGRDQQRVRVSGWLMLDPEHPDQVGKTRGTIWEIHPVMRVEVQQQGRWIPLDKIS